MILLPYEKYSIEHQVERIAKIMVSHAKIYKVYILHRKESAKD